MGTLDLMPTIVGLMGLPIPRTCHGKDLSGPILLGRDDDADSVPLFMPFTGKGQQGWRGVYTRRYTYSFDEGLDTSQRWNCLYDRKSDPWQTKNQFGSMRHRALQERLHRLSLEWMERFDDAFVPSAKLAQACFGAKGEPGWGVGDTCELIGRPIDLARFIETDSIGLCSQGSGK
jgi:arylsulfatase A-like enzyme